MDLLGALYTCISIIIVFEVLMLQMWLQEALSLDNLAFDVDEQSMVGTLERRRVVERIVRHRAKFPKIQLLALSIGLTAILALAAVLAANIRELPPVFTFGPVVILALTYFGVAGAIWRQGFAILRLAVRRLD
ncbi:hypothetical protein GCM10022226_59730 [Sphaerisporangium flaviroseum]|uniref:DUF2721 domain-containing protein n=1 Tax=Sphaerisporangium flaviroseum TaxID=509199 RepID=A0ABP7J0S3_9ACTN